MSLDLSKPVGTKSTKTPVEIITTNARGNYPVAGYIGDNEVIELWTINGKYAGEHHDSPYDLENVPQKRSGWVNVYSEDTYGNIHEGTIPHRSIIGGIIYTTKEMAISRSSNGCLGHAYIEWEE